MHRLVPLRRQINLVADSLTGYLRLLQRPKHNLPRTWRRLFRPVRRRLSSRRGYAFGRDINFDASAAPASKPPSELEAYFDSHTEGPGIWKWRHYFDVYDRYLRKFVGEEANVLEIGIYSGGSLEMWQQYFGPRCRVHGVDIAEVCKAYEGDRVKISIGDQADPDFWSRFLSRSPAMDIVIDDGGHRSRQQIATLEALLPHMKPGGVYVCEDVHGVGNEFHDYASGLARNLHASTRVGATRSVLRPTELQRMVRAVHVYPFMIVIERSEHPLQELTAPRRGTQWQPFYDEFSGNTSSADSALETAPLAGHRGQITEQT